MSAALSGPELSGPLLITRLKEQSGLKLKPARGLAEMLAIDHIEPPTPNWETAAQPEPNRFK